ncbi:MAG TPA: CusA/CzcA family heavy metal efflux RND transporter, partial [Phaeodactylibacter sp.]|nr:CusA/CzcA family heavy metal efflux RND transporter [Phaeodactylibacter sp.]
TGTNLTKTIKTMTQIEKILKTFPEVKQVVTRIGAAEVPTDPMSMEETDIIITLTPSSEWTSAKSKDGLADAFKEALSELPGLDYEFTQPIEMRFNELITGVRADLAIKIFGEDLSVLNKMAQKIKRNIEQVEGAADISVEKVEGLPQMSVKYLRSKIAKYGLNIEEVNRLLTMSFAGLPAGSVFEGEKQFDLVIRYDETFRKDINNIKNATIALPNGNQIPLSELAEISYTKGPAKISRDDTKRRIVVGVNVRNRDLESVVQDVQAIIDDKIKLPTGYSITYGGQFENLRNARARLLVAVPIALVLIFVLLYFAFQSAKEALMVYTAIPLSAVGGVLLLYLRDMPFSISAGVGFIALFGIAVLNGIVLIEHFKELKAHGMSDLHERILVGTQQRLRPVLLTAAAAALGFLPMAISTSAGAEVQRPLATVVVGGLISATFLTLIVLPVLYAIFDRKNIKKRKNKKSIPVNILLIFLMATFLYSNNSSAQTILSLDEAIDVALKNNAGLKGATLRIAHSQQLVHASKKIEPTHFYFGFDQNNIADNGKPLGILGAAQNFKLPSVYEAQKDLSQKKVALQEQQLKLDERVVKKAISKTYYTILYWENLKLNYQYLDSLYSQMAHAATRRYEVGESNYLEKLTTTTKKKEMALQLEQCQNNINAAYQELAKWLQTKDEFQIKKIDFTPLETTTFDLTNHPAMNYYQAASAVSRSAVEVEKKQLLPDFQAEYFLGSNLAKDAKLYNGFQLGVGIPLWRKSQRATVKAAEIEMQIIEQQSDNQRVMLNGDYKQLQAQLNKYKKSLSFYEEDGKRLSEEIINTSGKAFRAGEIDFLQYIQSLENAKNIEKNYLDSLIQYNLTVLEMRYF